MTDGFRARLFLEHDQLVERIQKLVDFILTPGFDALPEIDRADLREQLQHMRAYQSVLSRRVSRQCR